MPMGLNIGLRLCRTGNFGAAGAPTQQFDFRGGSMPSGFTFARASSASYFDSTGTLQQAASNTPRFDYDPNTKVLKGLLLEGNATNLAIQSNGLLTAPWTHSAAVTAAAAVSPDGTSDAFSLLASAQFQGVSQPFTFTGSTKYTLSGWIKSAVGNYAGNVLIQAYDGVSFYNSLLSLTPVWQRFSVTFTTAASPAAGTIGVQDNATSAWQTIHLYGLQLETGGAVTSYIPTTTTAASRASESLNNASIPWFNASAGSFVFEAINGNNTMQFPWYFGFSDGTSQNAIGSYQNNAFMSFKIQAGNVSQIDNGVVSGLVVGTIYKIGAGFDAAAQYYTANGAAGTTHGAISMPTGINQLGFPAAGVGSTGSYWLRNLSYWNTHLSNSIVQGLTT